MASHLQLGRRHERTKLIILDRADPAALGRMREEAHALLESILEKNNESEDGRKVRIRPPRTLPPHRLRLNPSNGRISGWR